MHYCAVARQTALNRITNLHICFRTEDWKEQEESKRAHLSHHLLLAMALSRMTHIWKEILRPRSLLWETKFCKFFVCDCSIAKIYWPFLHVPWCPYYVVFINEVGCQALLCLEFYLSNFTISVSQLSCLVVSDRGIRFLIIRNDLFASCHDKLCI